MSRFLPRTNGLVVLAVLAVVTACSSSPSGDSTALPSGPTLTTSAAPTTAAPTTASPTPASSTGTRRSPIRWLGPASTGAAAQVQEATKSYWSMVVRLAEQPNPDDPGIAMLSVPPQTGKLVTLFTDIRAQGLSQRGPIDGSVTVGTVGAATAKASTCLDQTLTRVYDKAGRRRPGSSGSRTLFTVALKRAGGTWKVSGVSDNDADCTPPK
jgi:hypothetical protein